MGYDMLSTNMLSTNTPRYVGLSTKVRRGAPHHATQRGNNRQQIFFPAADRRI